MTCDNCELVFERYSSKNKKHKFCSKKCYGKWRTKRAEKACKQCGKIYVRQRKSGLYCSNKCQWDSIKGEGHPNWLGGKSFEPYSIDWNETLKKAIRERDSYTCQLCGRPQDTKKQHAVHHIDYNKKNCNPENLITLCCSCHIRTNKNRKEWENYFLEAVKEKL